MPRYNETLKYLELNPELITWDTKKKYIIKIMRRVWGERLLDDHYEYEYEIYEAVYTQRVKNALYNDNLESYANRNKIQIKRKVGSVLLYGNNERGIHRLIVRTLIVLWENDNKINKLNKDYWRIYNSYIKPLIDSKNIKIRFKKPFKEF